MNILSYPFHNRGSDLGDKVLEILGFDFILSPKRDHSSSKRVFMIPDSCHTWVCDMYELGRVFFGRRGICVL